MFRSTRCVNIKRSVRALKYCVENDEYEHVRINALNSFAKIATPEAIERIKHTSYKDKSERVRNLASKILKKFKR